MLHTLAHFAFALLLCAWGVMIGIGISADVLRWRQERRQKPRKGCAQGLESVVGRLHS